MQWHWLDLTRVAPQKLTLSINHNAHSLIRLVVIIITPRLPLDHDQPGFVVWQVMSPSALLTRSLIIANDCLSRAQRWQWCQHCWDTSAMTSRHGDEWWHVACVARRMWHWRVDLTSHWVKCVPCEACQSSQRRILLCDGCTWRCIWLDRHLIQFWMLVQLNCHESCTTEHSLCCAVSVAAETLKIWADIYEASTLNPTCIVAIQTMFRQGQITSSIFVWPRVVQIGWQSGKFEFYYFGAIALIIWLSKFL